MLMLFDFLYANNYSIIIYTCHKYSGHSTIMSNTRRFPRMMIWKDSCLTTQVVFSYDHYVIFSLMINKRRGLHFDYFDKRRDIV